MLLRFVRILAILNSLYPPHLLNNYKPYLLYGLYQDNDKTLRFPCFNYTGGLVSHYAMNEINTFIKKDYHNKSYKLDYKGYSRSKNKVKLWIECNNFTYSLETKTKNPPSMRKQNTPVRI